VEKTYQSALGKISSGKGNLVRQVEQFRELGAQVKKPMPKAVIEAAEAEPSRRALTDQTSDLLENADIEVQEAVDEEASDGQLSDRGVVESDRI
jgi:DNA anti-recombination protein RmuC